MPSYVFVVEGKTDKVVLQSLTNNYIVITDGTNVSRETINHLQALENNHNIVIITDPDLNGSKISGKLTHNLKKPIVITVSRADIRIKKKIGVAEMDRVALLQHIAPYNKGTEEMTMIDYYAFWTFYRLNMTDKTAKQMFLDEFNLVNGALKSIHRQLQYLGLTLDEIKEWKKQ